MVDAEAKIIYLSHFLPHLTSRTTSAASCTMHGIWRGKFYSWETSTYTGPPLLGEKMETHELWKKQWIDFCLLTPVIHTSTSFLVNHFRLAQHAANKTQCHKSSTTAQYTIITEISASKSQPLIIKVKPAYLFKNIYI